MGKRSKKSKKKGVLPELPENMLPQNILPIGERVEEDKNVYIHQSVYKEIHKFTQNKTTNESGGMLIGSTLDEFGKTNIIISGFVVAKYCEAMLKRLSIAQNAGCKTKVHLCSAPNVVIDCQRRWQLRYQPLSRQIT